MKRSHCCGNLTAGESGQRVRLIGWVQSIRNHGGLIFIDLRDRSGWIQLVIDSQNGEIAEKTLQLRDESVIEISGKVNLRPKETVNPRLSTGEIEILVDGLQIHNIADAMPFPLDDERADKVNEELRLTYRYLDLRRPQQQQRLKQRHEISQCVREVLQGEDFWEIELPTLFKTTPEGAREFLVPSRLNPGNFYALAQSPQQYKQMLMVAGAERYYSLARCYRDEDLRADRQPEFTQIDLEMSFVDREDIYALIEKLLKCIWKEVRGIEIQTPFPRMPFREAMNRFGSDKPDLRFSMELENISSIFANSEFKVFGETVKNGGEILALKVSALGDLTQGEMKSLEDSAKANGAKGLAHIHIEKDHWKSPIAKFLSEDEKSQLFDRLKLKEGDRVFFAAADWQKACQILGKTRLECAELLQKRGRLTILKDHFCFLWVVDFPLLTFDDEQQRYVSTHHPFTSPVEEDIPLLNHDPRRVRGQHYDIVLNGTELGGGSIRIHSPELQKKIFRDLLQIPEDVIENRFGYMMRAFHFGAPPHGGIALGLDRLAALLSNTASIRDVIAFPKTQKGTDLMSQSPSPASEKQLRDLFIRSTI